jgi:predicted porin
MQRSLIAAAALLATGASAFAQSSVTIYGRVNLSVESQETLAGDDDTKMQNSSSRWGIKGVEDLGGGLKAGFVLESGFNPANGQASSSFWGRQSEVNLAGKWGMVRLGNYTSEAYYATADYVSMHNHDTGTSADVLYAYLARDNNKISYRTPTFGGAWLEAAVTEAGSQPDRSYDLAANWDAGPLHLGAGYQKNGDANQFAFRGLYEMGAFTFGGYIQRDEDGFGAGLGSRTTYRLSGMYAMGNTEFHLNWGHAGDYDNSVGDLATDQWTVGLNYNLSKRTKVYAFYTALNGDGENFYGQAFGIKNSIALGVRHNF